MNPFLVAEALAASLQRWLASGLCICTQMGVCSVASGWLAGTQRTYSSVKGMHEETTAWVVTLSEPLLAYG